MLMLCPAALLIIDLIVELLITQDYICALDNISCTSTSCCALCHHACVNLVGWNKIDIYNKYAGLSMCIGSM